MAATALRLRTDAFVEYLDDWLHVPDRELGDYSEQFFRSLMYAGLAPSVLATTDARSTFRTSRPFA